MACPQITTTVETLRARYDMCRVEGVRAAMTAYCASGARRARAGAICTALDNKAAAYAEALVLLGSPVERVEMLLQMLVGRGLLN
jgi:hypothetical protein